jgi:hypothetical protein
VSMACYLINRSPRVALDGKVTEEVWTSNEVDYSSFRVFDCPAYVHILSGQNLIRSLDNVSFLDMGKELKVTSFGIRRQTRQ